MNPVAGNNRRWVLALMVAVVVVATLGFLFRIPSGAETMAKTPPEVARPTVKLVNLKKNEAALTDPTPLFLPTEWNAGQDALPADARLKPGSAFAGYPPNLKFTQTELRLTFPSDVVMPAGPADALSAGKLGQIYLGLGSGEGSLIQLPARKGFVEVTDAQNGRRVFAEALTEAEPPTSAPWQPMEFLVAVDAAGLVGPPILTESSSVVSVDGYFQNYLVKTLHAGERLAPGFYRICVGP